MNVSSKLIPVLAMAVCLACERAAPSAEASASRGDEGVKQIRVDAGAVPTFVPRVRTSIGSVEGDSSQVLHRVISGYFNADRDIVISHGGGPDIRVYSRQGQLIRSVGSQGAGPGEFMSLTRVAPLPGDSILAYDMGMSRFSIFDTAGTFVRSFRVDQIGLGGQQPTWFTHFRGGLIVAVSTGLPEVTMYQDIPSRDSVVILHVQGPHSQREIAKVANRWWLSLPNASAYELRAVYDGPSALVAASDDRVYYSANDSAIVHIRGESNGHSGTWQLNGVAPAIADSVAPEHGTRYFEQLLTSDNGDVWISEARVEDGQRRWYRLASSGNLIGTMDLPASTRLLDIVGSTAIAKDTDSLGVEYVRLLDLGAGSA